jgi:glycosyltransferase involved in cell wall biosynthesis
MLHGSAVRNILLAEKPDIIEIYDNSVLPYIAGMTRMGWFLGLGRPMFVYFTGERFDTIFRTFVIGGRIGSWFTRRVLANFNLPMFDFYIANSPFVADELVVAYHDAYNPRRWEWFHKRSRRMLRAIDEPIETRLEICPRGVDTTFFSPDRRSVNSRAEICAAAGIPVDSTLVLSATRLSREKNVQLLPQIMERLAKDTTLDFRLLVAGEGPEEKFLRKESARFDGKIVFIGHLDKAALANYYANADIFVHPNPREPFGNVGLEALASGVACVFPNSGGILSYADCENAWLAVPEPGEFADAICEAASNSDLRRSKTAKALETAASNSAEAAVDRLLATYDRMFCEFKRRGRNQLPSPPKITTRRRAARDQN